MKKYAVVTGASSGIGLSVSQMLVKRDFCVYAFARDFSKCHFKDVNFKSIEVDITDTKKLLEILKPIRTVSVLVNCAGVGYFAPHENLSIKQIEEIIDTNLKAPLIITKELLGILKTQKGYIFNINSISGIKPALHGAAYGASKAGLIHFSTSLFGEARKSGLKVVNINPDITNTSFFDDLNFKPTANPMNFIEPSCISSAIQSVLDQREGSITTDITIQPQTFSLDYNPK